MTNKERKIRMNEVAENHKAKHTPGKWIMRKLKDFGVGQRGHHYEILHPLINSTGEYAGELAGYHIVVGEGREFGTKIGEADARLIAAAPELLEACKMAEDTIRRKEYVVHEGVEHLRAIRKAIAKAKGEK